jgi:hypothetical protein
MPDITVYINCDTRLAINLRMFDLGENDEFIFVIKNYNHINSPYVFMHKARKADIDENGEILFKIPPEASRYIKPGAFYNFSVMINAFDAQKETEYKKLTDNGSIRLEYGAHDLTIKPDFDAEPGYISTILGMRLELLDALSSIDPDKFKCEVQSVRLELIDEVSSVPPSISEILGMRVEAMEEG